MNLEGLIGMKDKVAVVTGAASGIGFATSKLLAQLGCNVVLLDIDEQKGKAAEEEIIHSNGDALFIACDVTSETNCQEVIRRIVSVYKKVDILFNNAGVIKRKNLLEHSEEEWDFVMDVSLKSIFLLSKQVIPIMKENGGGAIINTGSGWGLKGGDNAVSYCASKAGVVNLTKAMAIDHGKDNIRVNSICPGDTDTPLLRGEAKQLKQEEGKFLEDSGKDRPLSRIGTPEDIAKGVLFLASNLSEWVTGTTLVVDGGGLA